MGIQVTKREAVLVQEFIGRDDVVHFRSEDGATSLEVRDFGAPDKVTVTVESGDTLNAELQPQGLPLLGLATTRRLLAELEARFSHEGGLEDHVKLLQLWLFTGLSQQVLDYRTVDSK